jgi:hypothetical protein
MRKTCFTRKAKRPQTMNYKLVAAFGIALFVGCSAEVIIPDKVANAGGNGGAGGSSSGTAGSGGAPGCTCDVPDMSGTRLKVAHIEGADGSRANAGLFNDTQLGAICSFKSMADGGTYCVPDHVVMNTFTDAECKLPIYIVTFPFGKCQPSLPTFAEFDTRNGLSCADTVVGFRIYSADTSSPQTISTWYALTKAGECVGSGLPGNMSMLAYSVSLLGTQDNFVEAKYPQGI